MKSKLMYVPEHIGCRFYGDSLPNVFKMVSLKKGAVRTYSARDDSFILFVLSGKLYFTYSYGEGELCTAQMKFIPALDRCRVRAMEDSICVQCETIADLSFCSQFSIEHLKNFTPGEGDIGRYWCLPIKRPLFDLLLLFKNVYQEGLRCLHYQKLKRDEVLLYLRGYYSKEELALFFYEYLGSGHSFKSYVLSNVDRYATLDELIKNANMSRSTFVRRFKEVFGESPSKWMLHRKLDNILREIKFTNHSFLEISEKFRFSSSAYFATFCKKNFGKTPFRLRNEALSEEAQVRNIDSDL